MIRGVVVCLGASSPLYAFVVGTGDGVPFPLAGWALLVTLSVAWLVLMFGGFFRD